MINFEVSILKYKHSYLLGEEVNIGLLLFFEEDQSVEFLYPTSLQRIGKLYPDFSYSTLRKYFKSFNQQAKHVTQQLNKNNNYELGLDRDNRFNAIISNYFLIQDSTALFFSDPESGVSKSKEKVLNYYQRNFISLYDKKKKRDRKDEKYLIHQFEKAVETKSKKLKENLRTNITVQTDLFSEKFNYGWKNGKLNLITPISFDLTEEDYIKDKGYKWKGKLSSLSEVAREKEYKFDLLVSRPTSKKLFSAYDKVVELVADIDAPKDIIEEDDIDQYLEEANNYFNS